ncbi:MAG: creatininase family protein [Bryobacteraceae bacterium]
MKLKRLLFAELTRQDLRAASSEAMVVIPLGATEQHGPHLPVGTDYFTVEHLAREAGAIAAEEIPLLVAPALPFGCSQHHIPFGGTFSMTSETYYRAVYDLVLAAVKSGFTRLFLLNGHGGNHELAQLVGRDIALEHPAHIAVASYWTIGWDALVAENAHLGMRLPGHAGIFETSMILALRGELVATDRPHRDDIGDTDPRAWQQVYRAEHHGFWQSINGYTDSPDQATAERGERYRKAIIGSVAKAFVEFYRNCPASV